MATHVVGMLNEVAAFAQVLLLAPEPPPFAGTEWRQNRGRGLNVELAAALAPKLVVVLLGDLPLVTAKEMELLIAAAEHAGSAIAADHNGSGTNALALTKTNGFIPVFGKNSFARHRSLLPGAAVIDLPGLAFDVDTPDDLDRACATIGSVGGIMDPR